VDCEDDTTARREGKGNREKAGGEEGNIGWEKTEEMEPIGCGVMIKHYRLPGSVFEVLYPHQREGLRWLWPLGAALQGDRTGGILGDDMGLGKTICRSV
jgi:SNF2 family DNA or RNA helicase